LDDRYAQIALQADAPLNQPTNLDFIILAEVYSLKVKILMLLTGQSFSSLLSLHPSQFLILPSASCSQTLPFMLIFQGEIGFIPIQNSR
jgi:hypothetical protein